MAECLDTSYGNDNVLAGFGNLADGVDKSKGVVKMLNEAIATSGKTTKASQVEITLDKTYDESDESQWQIRVNGVDFSHYIDGVDGKGSDKVLMTCSWADFMAKGDVIEVSHIRADGGIAKFGFLPVTNTLA